MPKVFIKKNFIIHKYFSGMWQSMQFLFKAVPIVLVSLQTLVCPSLWQVIHLWEKSSTLPFSFSCVLWHVVHVSVLLIL